MTFPVAREKPGWNGVAEELCQKASESLPLAHSILILSDRNADADTRQCRACWRLRRFTIISFVKALEPKWVLSWSLARPAK